MLYLIRGLPGSGKTTVATALCISSMAVAVAADDYFTSNGEYLFDSTKLPEAHAQCQNRARRYLSEGYTVAVHNTFSQRWELQPYLDMVMELEVQACVIDLFDQGLSEEELAGRTVHAVPADTIAHMRSRWEHDWRGGNPIPPWERS